jgi:glycosyltransferase involved in cell wall biosynthesis
MTVKGITPLVSVIIPTQSRPDMLIRAVKSVTNQTYPSTEIVIVDDRSNYDIEAHLRKEAVPKYYRVIKNTRTPGAAGARNTGFNNSQGEFIGFLDDDDEWMPDKIEKQVEIFQECDNAVGIVIASYYVVQNGTKLTRIRNLEGNVFETLCREHVAGNTSIPLIRRSVLDEVGLFDEKMSAAQDTDLWLRIAKRYQYRTVNKPLGIIHWQGTDRITQHPGMQISGTLRFLIKHWPDLHPARKYKLIKRVIRLSVTITTRKVLLQEWTADAL